MDATTTSFAAHGAATYYPGVQDGADGVSPQEAELLWRQIGSHLEEQIHNSTLSGEPDCLALWF